MTQPFWAMVLAVGLGLGAVCPAVIAGPDDDELDDLWVPPPPVAVSKPSQKQERFNRYSAIGISATALAGLLFAGTKMYFAWKGWQKEQSLPRKPWDK